MSESADSRPSRPDFTDPPVIEVALSVGFEPLVRYANAHSGLFWRQYADRFSAVEEHPSISIPSANELQDAPQQIEIVDGPPLIRTWLVGGDGSELVQLQRDVFAHNWRKTRPTQEYPRYESVRDRFQQYFRAFVEFVHDRGLGAVEPNACEVTYVNHIPVGEHLRTSGDLGELMLPWSWPHTTFLPKPNEVGFGAQFVIRDENDKLVGRLNVNAKPAYRRSDRSGIIVLSMTARGEPLWGGLDGVLAFFDLGREWIVRGFADLTTPKMHRVWGRIR